MNEQRKQNMKCFKTTTVGLRLGISLAKTLKEICFKTTTVGLRLGRLMEQRGIDTLFQNHYGWIETAMATPLILVKVLFQNHYGWIETMAMAIKVLPVFCFKTTTVGLRHGYHGGKTQEKDVSKPLRLD